MSRVGAQKTISNFANGWVTEYSPLGFPANSLQEALNVSLKPDGSIETRTPFQTLEYKKVLPESEDSSSFTAIKTFKFPNQLGMLVVYLSPTKYRFNFMHKYTQEARVWLPDDGFHFFDIEKFDVAFLDDGFLFFLNEEANSGSRLRSSVVYRCRISEEGLVEYSQPTDDEDGGTTIVRVPETGADYNWSGQIGPATTCIIEQRIKVGLDYEFDYQLIVNGVHLAVISDDDPRPVFPISVEVEGSIRKYDRLNLRQEMNPAPDLRWRYYDLFYTVEFAEPSISGKAERITYRDTFGMPHLYNTILEEVHESIRYPGTSAFMSYNLFNAGWRWGDKVTYAATQKGDSVASGVGSLAAITRDKVSVWPCPQDSPDENKISTANNVEALGVYSPFLLDSDQPLVGRTRKGSHILSLTGEYKPNNYNPFLKAYFIPDFEKSLSSIISGGTPSEILLAAEFFTKAQDVSKQGGITACTYINGRAWYGVKNPSFNIAFSQIEERRVSGFDTAPGIGELTNCYQKTDPNAPEFNDLVATDGGTLSLRNVGTIVKIMEFRNYVLVFSTEGVWALYGGSKADSFSPVSFSIDKISSEGLRDNQHVVEGDNSIYYVSNNSIQRISVDEKNNLSSSDISTATLKEGVKDILHSFSSHSVCTMSYDKENKKVFFNYGKYRTPNSILTNDLTSQEAFNDLKYVANGMTTLVFDEILGSYYQWRGSSHNVSVYYTTNPLLPASGSYWVEDKDFTTHEPSPTFSGCLGFFYNGVRTVTLYETFKLEESNPTGGLVKYTPTLTGVTTMFKESSNVKLVDGEELLGSWVYDVRFSIPFETFDNPAVDKSVATATFYQESRSDKKSEIIMTADWDLGGVTNPVTLQGNTRYPVQSPRTHVPKILMNKVMIPGSGKYLSLDFTNTSDLTSKGCSFLGYNLSISMENRP